MYIAGFVIPVPEEKMEAYRKWAEKGAAIFREYGCIEIVESWEDKVPSGKYTDFRRAVDAKDGEKIVFTWQVWPDKATLESAEAKMHEDKRLEVRAKFRSTPSVLFLAALSGSTRWAASDMSAFRSADLGRPSAGRARRNRVPSEIEDRKGAITARRRLGKPLSPGSSPPRVERGLPPDHRARGDGAVRGTESPGVDTGYRARLAKA